MREYTKSRQVARRSHSEHLSAFELRSIEELASRELPQRDTPIGIVLDGYPTWMWQIGTLGSVKWMVSEHDLPTRATKDPLWIPLSSSSLHIEDVEVMLVDGEWPEPNHLLWKLKPLRVAVRVTMPQKARNKKRRKV